MLQYNGKPIDINIIVILILIALMAIPGWYYLYQVCDNTQPRRRKAFLNRMPFPYGRPMTRQEPMQDAELQATRTDKKRMTRK